MTTASGTREVAAPRSLVWRALAVLEPYCAVCDVSYVVEGRRSGSGARFVCVPGRLAEDQDPHAGAPRGEIVEWEPERVVATRLELTPETWTTRIELADAGAGAGDRATLVTITLTHAPRRPRLADRLSRRAVQQLVQRTVDGELDKLPAHVEQVTTG